MDRSMERQWTPATSRRSKIIPQNECKEIILSSETHFTDKSYGFFPNYKLYQANHTDGTAHGGAAILIEDTIHHYELPKYFEHHM
jgi:hypothetical protein